MIGMKELVDLAGMNRLIGPQDMVAIMNMMDITLFHHTMVLPIDNLMDQFRLYEKSGSLLLPGFSLPL